VRNPAPPINLIPLLFHQFHQGIGGQRCPVCRLARRLPRLGRNRRGLRIFTAGARELSHCNSLFVEEAGG